MKKIRVQCTLCVIFILVRIQAKLCLLNIIVTHLPYSSIVFYRAYKMTAQFSFDFFFSLPLLYVHKQYRLSNIYIQNFYCHIAFFICFGFFFVYLS